MRVGSLEIQIMAGMARLQKDMNDAQRIVGGSMANVEKSVASAKRAMQALGVGLPLAMITDQVRRMTDQYTKLDAQLRLSTKSQAQYAQGMSDIRRISTIAQADISATSMLYTRLMNVMQGTGVEQSKLATVTETVSYGLKAYGATAQEASSAALQLSQAMGANRLGGEEFRAVMEAMPNVMKVLADSMGVPLGALRQLSIDGKITADEMVKAFGNPAIAAEFKRLAENAQTITGAWVVARNELTLLVGEFMKSSGSTNVFISAFKAMGETFALLAKHMGSLILLASTYVAFLVTKLVVGMALAIEKSIAHTEALAMNAAGARAHAVVVAQASVAETAAASAAAAAKLAETIATREALFAAEAELVAKVASTRATIAQAQATAASAAGVLQSTIAKNAATVATTELAIAEAALTKINKARNADQVTAIAMDAVRTRELKAAAVATDALAAAEAARAKSALGWIAAIGAGLRAAAMAHPITAAVVAITAIVVAIANWKDVVDGGKASFSWFMNDFLGGIQFLAMGVGISLGELVQKLSLLATVTVPQLKSGEFKKQWDELGRLAEQSRIDAAAKIAGIDENETKRENFEQALRLAQDREAWDKLHATKQQQRAAEIAELNAQYVKLAGLQGRSQAEQMALAEEYRVKMSLINEKYSRADVKAAIKADKELQAMREASAKYEQDIVDGINAETDALLKKIEQERFDTEAIGKTAEQLALLQSVRYDNVTALQEQKLASLEANFASEAEIAAVREQIKARKELKGVWETQAAAQVRDAEKKAWKEIWDSVDKTAHDTFVSILNGGKDTATRLKEAFKNGFFDWLYSMTLKKWIVNISTVTAGGTSASAMAGIGGDGGGAGGVGSWLSMGSNVFSAMNAGITTSISQGVAQVGATFWNMGAEQLGNAIMSNIAPLTTAISYVGAGLAGISIGTALAGDKKFMGMSGQTTSTIGAIGGGVLGSLGMLGTLEGPLGALAGGAIGGLFNAAFGRGPKVSGTTTLAGQFSEAGFAGQYQTPWSQSGGWFSSGRSGMDVSPISPAQQAGFTALVAGSKSVFDNLIAASGEAGKSLNGWTFAINQQVNTEEQVKQLTLDVADSMGRYMIPSLAAFMQQGESLADTAVRMRDIFVTTDAMLAMVGQTFTTVGLASMQMRSDLIAAFGGVQQANTSMQAYYQAFFSEGERVANSWTQMSNILRQLGFNVLPTSNAGFRALVEAQDLSTAAGQQMFATLITLAPTFDQLTRSTAALQNQISTLDITKFSTLVDYTRAVRLSQNRASGAIPAFADGGVHTGGLRLVGENGPELEYTGPSTISSNSDTRNLLDNSSVVASVDALREELRALGMAIAPPIQKSYKIFDRWDGEGMPEVREAA